MASWRSSIAEVCSATKKSCARCSSCARRSRRVSAKGRVSPWHRPFADDLQASAFAGMALWWGLGLERIQIGRSRHELLRERPCSHPFRGKNEFKYEYRCIGADLRNANGGQSTGPLEIDRPWDSHTDDHLGLMNHLRIDKFMVLGSAVP